MLGIRTILHPTDFSAHSEEAFHIACSLARDFGARLVVMYAMPLGTVPFVALAQLGSQDATGNIRKSFMHELQKIRPRHSDVKVEHRLEDGDEVKAILRVAHEMNVDLIVMATHGRTGLSEAIMGSVSERVTRRAECPVMTISQPAHRLVDQAEDPPAQVG